MNFVKSNTKRGWEKLPDGRKNKPEYTERAVLEAMVNHFIHRDYTVMGGEVHLDIYDDRLTVTSPGGMYFIFVRCRNVLCCYHWLFLWYFIPLDSPILQENLIECICQRFQCIFSFDWFQLAFPNGDRMPAHSGKFMLNFQISLLVPLYFNYSNVIYIFFILHSVSIIRIQFGSSRLLLLLKRVVRLG